MKQACKTIGEYIPDNLIANSIHPIDVKAVQIAAGTEIYRRGTLINDKGTICNGSMVEDKKVLDVPIGILCEDVEQVSSETTASVIYISGAFNESEIIVGDDVTITDFEIELRKRGIFLK